MGRGTKKIGEVEIVMRIFVVVCFFIFHVSSTVTVFKGLRNAYGQTITVLELPPVHLPPSGYSVVKRRIERSWARPVCQTGSGPPQGCVLGPLLFGHAGASNASWAAHVGIRWQKLDGDKPIAGYQTVICQPVN